MKDKLILIASQSNIGTYKNAWALSINI